MSFSDVANQTPPLSWQLALDEVGLENVQTQIRVSGQLMPAKCEAAVSFIDKKSRGIHMSRLYKIVTRLHETEFSLPLLTEAAREMLSSQGSLSDRARLRTSFELPVMRSALLSREQGWRHYPVFYEVDVASDKVKHHLGVRVLYSSTCPCSAALSRQALQAKFKEEFHGESVPTEQIWEWLGREDAMVASAHAQRSEAYCRVQLASGESQLVALELIDLIEETLQTAVQAAVKREDEQEFARRNARHLMFCEDAARRLKAAFLLKKEMADFQIEVRHFESLHPHDVIARANKHGDTSA